MSSAIFCSAQIDSCGNDYRPINVLNTYEVSFLNSYVDNKPLTLNDSTKIAFVNGLGGGVLIVTKRAFFEDVKLWDKSETNPQLIILSDQEKINSNGFDVLLVYQMNKFGKLIHNVSSNDLSYHPLKFQRCIRVPIQEFF